jgi:hypothetical protein
MRHQFSPAQKPAKLKAASHLYTRAGSGNEHKLAGEDVFSLTAFEH